MNSDGEVERAGGDSRYWEVRAVIPDKPPGELGKRILVGSNVELIFERPGLVVVKRLAIKQLVIAGDR